MSFDFNEASSALTLYGIMPQTPYPVELSIYGYCRMSCSYCFANRNRDAFSPGLNLVNSTPGVFRKLDRAMQDPEDPIGFFLREKYPVCMSNRSDPFQRDEKTYRATEAFLAWAKATRTPLYIQTRGADVLLDEWDRYAPLLVPGKDVVYLSICQMDDAVRRKQEPGAPRIERRWELAARLRDHGIPVIAACNPYVKEWVPDPDAYCRLCAESGIRGIWLEALHFTAAQTDTLARPYRELTSKANILPMYLIGDLKRWYAACEQHGLDFFPTPRWDAYFGHRARHPECADPAWFGGKTFDCGFTLAKNLYRISREENRQVLFGWPEIEGGLRALGVPNPRLKVAPFWYPFNASVKADAEVWRRTLGKTAPLYEVLRYFWNHPWESQNFLWYHPLLQGVYFPREKKYATDADGNLVGCFDPKFNKHHGAREIDHDTEVDWDRVLWPQFEEATRAE